MQWIATKSIHAAEFFHGTVEMTETDMSFMLMKGEDETRPVSYTHLDVYKRQVYVIVPE